MAEWTAEVTVDEELARRLIGTQFPELASASLSLLAEGWDNTAWLVDETWVFRFPRRKVAVPLVEREVAVLPHLAPLLPVAIPAPEFRGRPTDEYAWPFLGSAFLRGQELGSANLTDGARTELAESLGRFLRVLHSPEIAATVSGLHSLPVDPNGRADMSRWVPLKVERLADAEELGTWRRPPSVDRLLEVALALPAAPASAFVHGDLHFRHLLIDDGMLTAVIDWGDLCLAAPSVDLQLVWSFFPPDSREAFLRAYGPISEEQLVRARVLALCISAVLAVYGRHESLPGVEREAVAGLERASAD